MIAVKWRDFIFYFGFGFGFKASLGTSEKKRKESETERKERNGALGWTERKRIRTENFKIFVAELSFQKRDEKRRKNVKFLIYPSFVSSDFCLYWNKGIKTN